MLETLSGETRLFVIVGHPIAQAMSPALMTPALRATGKNAVLVPIDVAPSDVGALIETLRSVRNLDGILATVRKFAAYSQAQTATERAHVLQAANALRRNSDGSWHADMIDGLSMVDAIRAAGFEPSGRRALLVGAGGAGGAIALGLLDAGVAELAVHDRDQGRLDALFGRLSPRYGERLVAGSPDPRGFDLIVNATPAGMAAGDSLPVAVARLDSTMLVADVITKPLLTPLLQAASAAGCIIVTGGGMFDAGLSLLVNFLLGSDALTCAS